MSNRKLQTEIDRVLKRVADGVIDFSECLDKLYLATTTNQRDKVEAELKKEIKKLQRYRDNIKTWIASSEVKDKTALLENRTLIEIQMEKFKHCEKDVKIKPFSKEGLNMKEKVDPKEIERRDLIEWIASRIADLNLQIEKQEAEAEQLQITSKKKSKDLGRSERMSTIAYNIEQERFHVGRLELVNRLLENCVVSTEKGDNFINTVLNIKDDIEYYVANNQEGIHETYEDMYVDLSLEEEEELHQIGDIDYHDPINEDTSLLFNEDKESIDASPPVQGSSVSSEPDPLRNKVINETSHTSIDDVLKDLKERIIPTNAFGPSLPVAKTASVLPTLPQKYAAAAAAAATKTQAVTKAPTSKAVTLTTSAVFDRIPSASLSKPLSKPPGLSQLQPEHRFNASPLSSPGCRTVPTSASASRIGTSDVFTGSQKTSTASSVSSASSPKQISSACGLPGSAEKSFADSTSSSPSGRTLTSSTLKTESPAEIHSDVTAYVLSDESVPASPAIKPKKRSKPVQEAVLPPTLADLGQVFDMAKQRGCVENPSQVQIVLDCAQYYAPDHWDVERYQGFVPRNPWPTPSYYPQNTAKIMDTPEMFEKFDSDCLFFIFYSMQGTYHQYLAAQELKRQSWRFHTKYLTWFQRHEEPTAINDEYEEGTYTYFDYENAWCQRRKEDFRFEYKYLEG